MTQELPTTLIGLVGLLLLLGFNVWQGWQARHVQKTVTEVQTQVTNGGSNLAMTVGEIKSHVSHISERLANLEQKFEARPDCPRGGCG